MRGGMGKYPTESPRFSKLDVSSVETQAKELDLNQTYELLANEKGMIGFGDTEYPRPGPKVQVKSYDEEAQAYGCEIIDLGNYEGVGNRLGKSAGDTVWIVKRSSSLLPKSGMKKYPFKIRDTIRDTDIYIRCVPSDETTHENPLGVPIEKGQFYTLTTSLTKDGSGDESTQTVKAEQVDDKKGEYHMIHINKYYPTEYRFVLKKREFRKDNVQTYPYKYKSRNPDDSILEVYVKTPVPFDHDRGLEIEEEMKKRISDAKIRQEDALKEAKKQREADDLEVFERNMQVMNT
tara:strand:+ start:1156 stop:2028 length:873 start_codon:yes stop_codon:yes gene_type:complete